VDGIYLDHAATSPLDPRVLDAMLPWLRERWGNPASRHHRWGWDAYEAVECARAEVAAAIGAEPVQIVFTSGATESLNLAILGLFGEDPGPVPVPAIVSLRIEHDAVRSVLERLRRRHWANILELGVDTRGVVDIEAARRIIEESRPRLVIAMLVNNEIGTLQPLAAISGSCRHADALLLSDITQAVGKTPVDLGAMGADMAAFSAHKLGGPQGVGALYVRSAVPLQPVISGGQADGGLRGGTVPVAAVVGFGQACRLAAAEASERVERMRRLRDRLETALTTRLPGVWCNGLGADRACHICNLGFEGVVATELMRHIDGIAVSTRSACSTGTTEPSHVLTAIGLDATRAGSCLRFSLGPETTEDQIDRTIAVVGASLRRLRSPFP
jgi:cysteine desulfurase